MRRGARGGAEGSKEGGEEEEKKGGKNENERRVIIEWRPADRRGRQGGVQEMKESDYAQGTGDAGTKPRLRCLSTHLHNAAARLTFSPAANFKSLSFAQQPPPPPPPSSDDFKDFDCVASMQHKTLIKC